MDKLPLYKVSRLTIYGNYHQVFTTNIVISGLIEANNRVIQFSQAAELSSAGEINAYSQAFTLRGDYLLSLSVRYSNTASRLDMDLIGMLLQRNADGSGGLTYSFPPGVAGSRNPYLWPSVQDFSLNRTSLTAYQSTGDDLGTAGQQFEPGNNTAMKIIAFDFTLETDATAITRTVRPYFDSAVIGICPKLCPNKDVSASSTFHVTGILRGGCDFSNADHYFCSIPDKWLWSNEQIKFAVDNGQAGDDASLRLHYLSISEAI
jgi:hypothetical protein